MLLNDNTVGAFFECLELNATFFVYLLLLLQYYGRVGRLYKKLNPYNIYHPALWEKSATPSLEKEGLITRVAALQGVVFLDHQERGRAI